MMYSHIATAAGALPSNAQIATRSNTYPETAYVQIIIDNSGTRRRYGTFRHEDTGTCELVSEDQMNETCSNFIGDETKCFDCMACESWLFCGLSQL
eukprot:Skav205031  [mRNA]  locus=scaffold2669:54453:54938:- [translate_table: standard]